MKSSLLLLILLGGCTANTSAPVEAKANPEPAKVEQPAPAEPTSEPTASVSENGDNPNRINQLRELKRVKIPLPKQTVDAWVMDNNSRRQEGMMFLTDAEAKDTDGMLFVFPSEGPRSFWMQNTLIGLDIIYIAKDGTVVSIAKGKPKDETSLPSDGPAMYVLELKGGKAAEFGVKKGTKIKMPPVKAIE